CTSATIAREYRILLEKYAQETSDMPEFVDYQAHDFSFRGMNSVESACISGMAHLQYFKGTDTIPALFFNKEYYGKDFHIASVPATEHSVMSAGGKEDELGTYRRLLTEIYPRGILSIVSDTWDLWHVITNTLPILRTEILSRDGKLVIRPDSGDPADILCGIPVREFDALENALGWAQDNAHDQASDECGEDMFGDDEITRIVKVGTRVYEITFEIAHDRFDKRFYVVDSCNHKETKEITLTPQQKGVVELLWEIFGGKINSKGFKQLDEHIGVIYGDSITLERCGDICERLRAKGFASTNVVFGIGSYTYQYNTRDTLGWAMKATYCEINDIGKAITKDPITDDGTKKSHSGILKVVKDGDSLTVLQNQTWDQFRQSDNELKLVYKDGEIL